MITDIGPDGKTAAEAVRLLQDMGVLVEEAE